MIHKIITMVYNTKLDQWAWLCICGASGMGFKSLFAADKDSKNHLKENED